MSTSAVILSGGGDYVDPWHPFAATTAVLAGLLDAAGVASAVEDTVDGMRVALARRPRLAIVNAGNGPEPHPRDRELLDAIEEFVAAGGALHVRHVAATMFPEDARWERLLGGRWVRGITMHPERGPARIRVTGVAHPVTAGLADFDTVDERYSWLRVDDGIATLATQEHDGVAHPLVWARELGAARIVYDALGHDVEAYAAAEPRTLFTNAVRWQLGR